MAKKLLTWIGGALMASMMLWAPAPVYAWQGTLSIRVGSIDCFDLVTGGTRQTINDGAASCSIAIKAVATQCVNKGGKSQNSSSHIFELQNVSLSQSQSGSQFGRIDHNGNTSSQINFTNQQIADAVAASGVDLSAAVLCPNRNFSILQWYVSRFDLVATVNGTTENWVPYFPPSSMDFTGTPPDPLAYKTCDPVGSGLTYAKTDGAGHFVDSFGNPTTDPNQYVLDSTQGILGECWIFRNQTFVDDLFPGTDNGYFADIDLRDGKLLFNTLTLHPSSSGSHCR